MYHLKDLDVLQGYICVWACKNWAYKLTTHFQTFSPLNSHSVAWPWNFQCLLTVNVTLQCKLQNSKFNTACSYSRNEILWHGVVCTHIRIPYFHKPNQACSYQITVLIATYYNDCIYHKQCNMMHCCWYNSY